MHYSVLFINEIDNYWDIKNWRRTANNEYCRNLRRSRQDRGQGVGANQVAREEADPEAREGPVEAVYSYPEGAEEGEGGRAATALTPSSSGFESRC